jgi:glycogen debranching enzyme
MIKIPKTKNTLIEDIDALRSPEGYLNAGIPNYDHLFGRDACVSALQLLDFDQEIARNTLKTMARYQAKRHGLRNEAYPGKMLHEHFPGGTKQILASAHGITDKLRKLYILFLWRFPYYGSVDVGAWFIILLHRYFKKTGDEAFLREMWPAAMGIVRWLEKSATNRPSKLVAYRRTYIFGLLNQSWKDTIDSTLKPPTAMVEVQGYYYEAYNCLSELSMQVFNNSRDSERYARKAEKLKNSLNKFLWKEETGFFSLGVNDRGKHDSTVTSNPGHLLFTGILSDEQAESIVNRLMVDDMLTLYGIRTLSSAEKSFDVASYQQGSVWPFDNWVFYQGLLKLGYNSEANIIKSGLLAARSELGNIPELYIVSRDNQLSIYPEACTIQAWSAGALINMTTCEESVL